MLRIPLLAVTLLGLSFPAAAQSIDWRTYEDSALGYSVDVPLGLYENRGTRDDSGGLTFFEESGDGQLTIFGAENTDGFSVAQLAEFVRESGQIEDLTYSRHGNSWFVRSGYAEGENGETLIVYTKFLFNPDRSAFSGFEISYPLDDKRRYDPVVTRIEKSLRSPAAS